MPFPGQGGRENRRQDFDERTLQVGKACRPTPKCGPGPEGWRWALILLDVRMPGISGLEVLEQVKARAPEVPVLVITAYGNVEPAITLNSMAEVSGKVSYVHPNLKAGETIPAGTPVVRIDAEDYAVEEVARGFAAPQGVAVADGVGDAVPEAFPPSRTTSRRARPSPGARAMAPLQTPR